jgi:hypothetical protein
MNIDVNEFQHGKGWNDITTKALQQIAELYPEVELQQAKEKFGILRLYVTYPQREELCQKISKIIDEAEKASSTVCENCGKTGQKVQTRNGWMTTRCDECQANRFKTT